MNVAFACKVRPDAQLPLRVSPGAIGYDVFASSEMDRQTKEIIGGLPVTIEPGDAKLIGIGVVIAIPFEYEIQVRPRSGLASKFDIELSNSPGTVDPDFRGEVGCLLRNRGSKPFTIEPGMRIAQLIFNRIEIPELREVENINELPLTLRGAGGFGSTGLTGTGLGTGEYDQEVARIDQYFMGVALATAALSNCVRGCKKGEDGRYLRDANGQFIGQTRRYGCVIAKGLRIIASGFNAQHPGSDLCAEVGCMRDQLKIPSGQQLEVCRAIHAEQMAIDTAAQYGVAIEGATMYVNSEPCLFCAKNISGVGIQTLVTKKGGYGETTGLQIIRKAGIRIREIKMD